MGGGPLGNFVANGKSVWTGCALVMSTSRPAWPTGYFTSHSAHVSPVPLTSTIHAQSAQSDELITSALPTQSSITLEVLSAIKVNLNHQGHRLKYLEGHAGVLWGLVPIPSMMKKPTVSSSQSSHARMQAYFRLDFCLRAAGNQEIFGELSQFLNGGLNI